MAFRHLRDFVKKSTNFEPGRLTVLSTVITFSAVTVSLPRRAAATTSECQAGVSAANSRRQLPKLP